MKHRNLRTIARTIARTIVTALLLTGLLGSCLGVKSDISIRRNGSGSISLEYRISGDLESLGKLEGNALWPPLPVGRGDFERTAARVPGLSLDSFNVKTGGGDVVSRVKLDFADTQALLGFLDAAGQRAALTREGDRQCLSLSLGGGNRALDQDLAALVLTVCEGYSLEMNFSLPGDAEMALFDGNGRRLDAPPAGWVVAHQGGPGISVPMGRLLTSEETLRLEIRWAW
jgi:hypothetical protein